MRKQMGAVGILLCGIAGGRAHAHGVVGQRSFIEPFITEDVNPKNELVIARPEWDHARDGRTLSFGFGLEKKISDRFSLTLDSSWLDITPKPAADPHASGFDNLGVTLKYAFFIDPVHEAIASIALESTAPTGTEKVGAEQNASFKPFLLYGKGLNELPDALEYLRPFGVQGDAGFEIAIDRARTTTLAHNVAIEYSIPYLQQAVHDFGLAWPLSNFIGDTEFNFEHGEPRVGSTVGSPPSSLTLRFTEGVEAAFSKVEVTDATGKRIETGPLEHPESNVIAVSLPGLAPGSYTVSWSVVSVDTHPTDGHFTFTVKDS